MGFCPNCGKEIKEDFEFCPNCGKSLLRQFPSIASSQSTKKNKIIVVGVIAILIAITLIGVSSLIMKPDFSAKAVDYKVNIKSLIPSSAELTLIFDLRNNGSATAHNVRIKTELITEIRKIVVFSAEKDIGTLATNEVKRVEMSDTTISSSSEDTKVSTVLTITSDEYTRTLVLKDEVFSKIQK